MHLTLTDVLCCPQCGPEYGLIVVSDRMADRRVLDGRLGCPNCQRSYPVRGGIADLRPEAGPTRSNAEPALSPVAASDLAALIGLTGGPGFVTLAGGNAQLAAELAGIVSGLEWIVLAPAFTAEPEQQGVNRVETNGGVPLRSSTARGAVVLDGSIDIREVVRTLRPAARLVISRVDDVASSMLAELGMRTLARSAALLVAERSM